MPKYRLQFRLKGMDLYFDGNFEVTVPNGELPAYHTFVVNENTIVTVKVNSVGMYLGYELLMTARR